MYNLNGAWNTGVIIQLINEACENKRNLVVLMLDLTNTYESICHKLVDTAPDQHNVPRKITDFVLNYWEKLASPWEGDNNWFYHLICPFHCCDEHAAQLSMARVRSLCHQEQHVTVQIRAFMDWGSVTSESVTGSRWIQQGLEKLITLTRMSCELNPGSWHCSRAEWWINFTFSRMALPSHLPQKKQSRALPRFLTAIFKIQLPLSQWFRISQPSSPVWTCLIQSLDIPTWHPPLCPWASSGLQGTANNCRVYGEEDKQLSMQERKKSPWSPTQERFTWGSQRSAYKEVLTRREWRTQEAVYVAEPSWGIRLWWEH